MDSEVFLTSLAFFSAAKKWQCSAMDSANESTAKCKVGICRCSWRDHVNRPEKIVMYTVTEPGTYEDLNSRYNIVRGSVCFSFSRSSQLIFVLLAGNDRLSC